MQILKLNLSFGKSVINVAKISINAYYIASKLKKSLILTIFMRNQKFQVAKKAKLKTKPKIVILIKYNDFLNIFFKKNFGIFLAD